MVILHCVENLFKILRTLLKQNTALLSILRQSVTGVTSQLFSIIWWSSTAQYSPVQSSTPQHSPLEPRTALYNPVEPNSLQKSLLEASTGQYSPSSSLTLYHLNPIFLFRNRIVYFVLFILDSLYSIYIFYFGSVRCIFMLWSMRSASASDGSRTIALFLAGWTC